MARVIVIHGNGGGTAEDNWQPWLKKQLELQGNEVIVPTMPDNITAHSSVWLPFMKDTLQIDEETVVVGHSSGAVAAMRYAEENKVKGLFLVGVCYTDLGDETERASGYYDSEWLWANIKANSNFQVVLASSDDPWIDVSEPRHIYQSLQCEYHEYTSKGHFMTEHLDSAEFPELLQLINNYIGENY